MNKKDILKIKDYENRSLNFIIEEMKHQFPKNKFDVYERFAEQEDNNSQERPSIYKN